MLSPRPPDWCKNGRQVPLGRDARGCTRGAAVIEDDYDSEFRYDGRSLDALKTLDQADLVFYVGTFSKSLFPEIRLGFVVVPKWAQPALVEAKRIADWHGTVLAQEALAPSDRMSSWPPVLAYAENRNRSPELGSVRRSIGYAYR